MRKQTCGPLYLDGITHYAKDAESRRLFAAGFVSGQAEKVYLGAAQAAMFRPSKENWDMVMKVAGDVAERYGLQLTTLNEEEIWILRDDDLAIWQFKAMSEWPVNSPDWHRLRGLLCGVPVKEIDLKFHERKGFGERCD